MIELSIVVPSRDSGPRLGALLGALHPQLSVAPSFEVVIVDDGSRVPVPLDVGAPFAGLTVRVVRRDRSGGIAVARNAGWRVADGRVCLFLDDDITPDPELVARHVAAHPPGARRVGIGRLTTRVADDADWLARRFADAWNRHVAALDAGRSLRPDDAYGGNLSIPTELLRAADGFDETLPRSEDAELAVRLVENGAELVYVPGDSDHREHKAGAALLADARRNGEVAPRLVGRHPGLLRETQLGAFAAVGQRQLALRRAALALRIPAEWLARPAALVGAGRRGRATASLLVHQAYWSGIRQAVDPATFADLTDGTAVLMYHAFARPGEAASRYVVPGERFEAQLRALLRAGHRPIALSELLARRAADRPAPARSFVVTIDDGYAEAETVAAPVLERLRVPATVFVVGDEVGGSNRWDRDGVLAGRSTLDAAAIGRLLERGLELGIHSATHARLSGASPALLAAEVSAAADRLRDRYPSTLAAYAYPFGAADDAARAAVLGCGLVGLGVREGLACPVSPDAELPRIEVRGTDSPARVVLAARLGGTRRLLRR